MKKNSQHSYDELKYKFKQDLIKQVSEYIQWAKNNPGCSFEFDSPEDNIHICIKNGKIIQQ